MSTGMPMNINSNSGLPMLSGPADQMRIGLSSLEGTHGIAPHPIQQMVFYA